MNNYEKHLNHLIDLTDSIDVNKITILTGPNSSGKSLIRKLIASTVAKERPEINAKEAVASISQERRTNSNPSWGALSSIFSDLPWNPTSLETYHLCKRLSQDNLKGRYLIFDEPEIGMSEEGILGWSLWFKKTFGDYSSGILIITHSRILVDCLRDISEFVNISGLSRDEWLNREIIPVDFDQLEEESDKLYQTVQKRIEETKKRKQKKD